MKYDNDDDNDDNDDDDNDDDGDDDDTYDGMVKMITILLMMSPPVLRCAIYLSITTNLYVSISSIV